MKFLCDHCQAKYRIPDEKIAGRTLRMKCRKCDHDILIHGETLASVSSAPSASPGRGASTSSDRASVGPALGSDFRKRVRSQPVSAAPAPEILWHVSIQGVPVGPVKRAELARKVGAGAVDGDSLVWREGFDDWRPLREVPRLASLLAQRRSAVPRMSGAPGSWEAARSSFPPPPPQPSGSAALPSSMAPLDQPASGRPSTGSWGPAAASGAARAADASSSSSMGSLPIGAPISAPPAVGRATQPPSEVTGSHSQPFIIAPQPRLITPGVLIAMVGVTAFAVAMAVLLVRPGQPQQPQVVVVPASPTHVPQAAAPQPTVHAQPAPAPDEAEEETVEPSDTEGRGRRAAQARRGRPAKAAEPEATDQKMSAADRRLLEQFGKGGDDTASLDALKQARGPSNKGDAEPLDARTLSRVVSKNKSQAGRCWELAIRGVASPPTTRMNVQLTVAPSGRVSDVSVSGDDFGGLKDCLVRTVERWRFPRSSESSTAAFPLVFGGR